MSFQDPGGGPNIQSMPLQSIPQGSFPPALLDFILKLAVMHHLSNGGGSPDSPKVSGTPPAINQPGRSPPASGLEQFFTALFGAANPDSSQGSSQ